MITVRRAKLTDVPSIWRLTLDNIAYTVPDGRDIPNAVVMERTAAGLQGLDLLIHKKSQLAILVAVDDEQGVAPVGFLMLEFHHVEDSTGELQSFISNMAVDSAYWGRYVGHLLVREAAKVSAQRGFRYMTAKVTASNERTIMSCLQVGFEIERYQLTMACSPDGPAKMPERPLHERGHAVSRLLRKSQRRRKADPANPNQQHPGGP